MLVFGVEVDKDLGEAYRRGPNQQLFQTLGAAADPASWFLLGLCYSVVGKYADAQSSFDRCEKVFPDAVKIQRHLISVVQHRGLDEAVEALETLSKQPGLNTSLLGSLWHVRGLAEGKLRHAKESVSALLESLKNYQQTEDYWGAAQVRDTLGTTEAARGHLDSAVHCYSMALVDKCRLGDRLGMALTLGNLGRVHLRVGRFADAIACFEIDRTLCSENQDLRGACRMHNDLGRAWMASRDWSRAEEELSTGIALAKTHRFYDIQFYCHKDMAILRIEQRDYNQAKQEIENARAVLPADSAAYMKMVLDTTEGELMVALQDPLAIDQLKKSVEAFRQSELPDWEIPARIALAKAYLQSMQTYAAERCLLAASRLARSNGYQRYFAILNEAMTHLDISSGAEIEEGKLLLPTERDLTSTSEQEQSSVAGGNYLIREQLGKGGFGSVYRAYDSQRGIEVALKLVSVAKHYDSELRSMLLVSTRNEIEAASRIRHPGIVRVYALGNEHSGDLYVCQELIVGQSLRNAMNSSDTQEIPIVLEIAKSILFALEALHEANVVHRDLKPQNILMRNPTEPVLIDFGISQLRPRGWFDEPDYSGTLEYMSPEQSFGKSVDARSDLYSIGVILYEWLAGRRPIRLSEPTWTEKAKAIQTQSPKPISIYRPDLHPKLGTLVHQLLEKKPRRRPANARAAIEQIQGVLDAIGKR